jgi:hypothetical protein
MNFKNAILPVFLALSLLSCSKDDIPQPNSIIGKWNIVQIDSVRSLSDAPFNAYHISTIPWTGKIAFNKDSSGQFLPAIPFIADTVLAFTWSHNKITNRIIFNSSIGQTYAIVKYQVADTLEIYLRGFIPSQGIGVVRMYYLKITK